MASNAFDEQNKRAVRIYCVVGKSKIFTLSYLFSPDLLRADVMGGGGGGIDIIRGMVAVKQG